MGVLGIPEETSQELTQGKVKYVFALTAETKRAVCVFEDILQIVLVRLDFTTLCALRYGS